MKKTAKKMLCLLILMGLLSPVIVRGQQSSLPCESGDNECMAMAYAEAWGILWKTVEDARIVYGDYLTYVSTRFNVDLRIDQNGYDVFRSLYPNLTKLVEQEIARKYGISLPLKSGKSLKELGVSDAISLVFSLMELGDHFSDIYINSMVLDFQNIGLSEAEARIEANTEFLQLTRITNLSPLVAIATLKTQLEIFASRQYHGAWQGSHQSRLRELTEARGAHRGADNGRSYMDWATRRDGAGGSIPGGPNCIYIPPRQIMNCVSDDRGVTCDIIGRHEGYWVCP